MWTNILSGLFKPLGDIFKEREKRKTAVAEAKAKQEEILAHAAAADSTVAGQIALVNAQNQNNTWKDEFALITIAAPYWVSFVLVLGVTFLPVDVDPTVVIKAMFEPMAAIPEYWQETFKVAIWAAMGITGVKRLLK